MPVVQTTIYVELANFDYFLMQDIDNNESAFIAEKITQTVCSSCNKCLIDFNEGIALKLSVI